MLKIDFYESGVGETIILTFPNGGVGVVDAHPSFDGARPGILDLLNGKDIHFVCLTHPHADHGKDLIPVLQKHPKIGSFWHTVSDLGAFFFFPVTETTTFPSHMRKLAMDLQTQYAKFLIDIFHAVKERRIKMHQLRSDLLPEKIDEVEIHCLSPEEAVQHEVIESYRKRHAGEDVKVADSNLLSAVLLVHYAGRSVLLGSDALKKNWITAVDRHRDQKLPRADVVKIPHHGAANAIYLNDEHIPSYLDLCNRTPKCKSILFAGDSKHPHPSVFKRLQTRTDVQCITNGIRTPMSNPLNISIPGARQVAQAAICNPQISIKIHPDGSIEQPVGIQCESCTVLV